MSLLGEGVDHIGYMEGSVKTWEKISVYKPRRELRDLKLDLREH